MSVQLEVSLSPHPQPDPGARCKIIRVELHVGRDQLGQWHADDKDNDWSVDEDIRIPV
jgi:predicted component of type VI protein secretion system